MLDPIATNELDALLPLFDGFPYITTRLVPAAYHVLLLPEWSQHRLEEALRLQVAANQMQAALVLSPDEAVYLSPGSQPACSTAPPRSTIVLAGRLHAAVPFDDACLDDRWHRLVAFARHANRHGGVLLGDITKGGRPATRDELRRLAGVQPCGVPNGLLRCAACGDWRGECLSEVEGRGAYVVPVHCLCDNTTRCARCGLPLHDRRVGGNRLNPDDNRVWHCPGFVALSHCCPDSAEEPAASRRWLTWTTRRLV